MGFVPLVTDLSVGEGVSHWSRKVFSVFWGWFLPCLIGVSLSSLQCSLADCLPRFHGGGAATGANASGEPAYKPLHAEVQSPAKKPSLPSCLRITLFLGTDVGQLAAIRCSVSSSHLRRGSEICWSTCTAFLIGFSSLAAEERWSITGACIPIVIPFLTGFSPAWTHLGWTYATSRFVASLVEKVPLLLSPQRFRCAGYHAGWSLLFVFVAHPLMCWSFTQTSRGFPG